MSKENKNTKVSQHYDKEGMHHVSITISDAINTLNNGDITVIVPKLEKKDEEE